jgi:hypothetical protein
MTIRRFALAIALVGAMALPAAVLGATPARTLLAVGATHNARQQPTITFEESSPDRESTSPPITRFRVSRPASFAVKAPTSGVTLGRLQYSIGPHTLAASKCCRTLSLRRHSSLGGGRYVLADANGTRLVLSTSSHASFLTVTLPSRAYDVTISFNGAGARLFAASGSCKTQTFTGYFTTSAAGTVQHSTASMDARTLRVGRLC